MKELPVMAIRDFDHKGKARKTGQLFWMRDDDYEVWGGFVRIVRPELVPNPTVTKPARTTITKGRDGGDSRAE